MICIFCPIPHLFGRERPIVNSFVEEASWLPVCLACFGSLALVAGLQEMGCHSGKESYSALRWQFPRYESQNMQRAQPSQNDSPPPSRCSKIVSLLHAVRNTLQWRVRRRDHYACTRTKHAAKLPSTTPCTCGSVRMWPCAVSTLAGSPRASRSARRRGCASKAPAWRCRKVATCSACGAGRGHTFINGCAGRSGCGLMLCFNLLALKRVRSAVQVPSMQVGARKGDRATPPLLRLLALLMSKVSTRGCASMRRTAPPHLLRALVHLYATNGVHEHAARAHERGRRVKEFGLHGRGPQSGGSVGVGCWSVGGMWERAWGPRLGQLRELRKSKAPP